MNYLPFTEVFNDESGGNIKTQKGDYLEVGQIPIVDQGEDLIGGFTDEENKLCKSDLPIIIFGDHTRRFKFVDFPFGMGADGVKVLKPKIEADEKYLYYYLKALHLTDAGYDRHFKYLKRTEILIPPLPEQKRIAEVLDKADALREKRRLALQKLDTLLQSVFLEMFGDPVKNPMGWDSKPLGKIAEIQRNSVSPENIENGTLYVGLENVTKNGDFSDVQEVETGEIKSSKFVFSDEHILYGKLRPYLRKIAVPNFSGVCSTDILPILAGESIERSYLLHFLRLPEMVDLATARSSGANLPRISPKILAEMEIIVPPMDLQIKYDDFQKKIVKLMNLQIIESQKLENLFQSLQQKAFKGELFENDVREEIKEALAD